MENPNVNYKGRCATALQIVRDMRKATYSENAAVIELQAYLTWLTGDPSAKEIASEALALDANRPLAGMVVESVSKDLYPACVA